MFAAAAVLAIGQGLKFVIDRGFAAGSGAELDRTLALMLGVVVVMALATYARFYFVSWLGERVTPTCGARCSITCWRCRRATSR